MRHIRVKQLDVILFMANPNFELESPTFLQTIRIGLFEGFFNTFSCIYTTNLCKSV